MADDRVRLERDQQRLVQAVYDSYRGTGNWPTFDNIDRQLDRGRWPLDAGKVLRDIPDSILIPSPFAATNPDQPLKLKLEGIAACKGSDEDVSLFLDREPPPRPRKPQLTYPA
ncbi:hypothetical protein ACFQFC_35465 [Amorphoplanes digitatis]|uniref:Uncharacterized protein n=1 Tax=Actinoplanes digitatis TaxID=1868 RepID=A0A7W7HVE4_9ACTN|nr:hypothetical protein [Actinoplanes digitatis]MBB4761460.1 hypothetical protein [Actinoplanes digitatis]GID97694.1 hypothetical protein Adi01nite_71060 [Actinoplanes digitatis]